MDAQTFADLISKVGFPVAAASFLIWQGTRTARTLSEEQRRQYEMMVKQTEILTQISERLAFILRELDDIADVTQHRPRRSDVEVGAAQ